MDAELSSASGWHARIPLQPAVRFEEARTQGHVELDLDAMSDRAAAAAAVIGMPIDQVDVVVLATVRSADGETFTPRLTFVLTPTQFQLASEVSELEFRDRAEPTLGASTTNSVEIAGWAMEVSVLRVASGGVSAAALGVLAWVVLTGRQRVGNETRLSPHKYRGLLLEIEPMISPPGRPIVDVADFTALSTLAQRYGVLVLHWTRDDVRTFVVHDDGVTYRYRVGVAPRTPASRQPAVRTTPLAGRRSPRVTK
jgi:hypothetical protein